MSYTQVASLTDFSAGTTIVSAEVDANFTAIRDVVNGVVTGSNTIAADTINEVTSANGVTIDSVLLKDGQVQGTTGNGFLDLAGDSGATVKVRLTDTGLLALGDTANANMAVGLTINQGANDDNVIDLKSSDVAHAYTNGQETDSFFTIRKSAAALGGASLTAVAEDSASLGRVCQFILRGGEADTTHTSSGEALYHISAAEHDGAGSLADVTATGNVFAVAARVSGSDRTVFIIDEDGNYWFDGAAQSAFDAYDDAELVRAFALATSKDTIRTDFDDFVRYSEDDLVDLGILGDRVENGGLVNGAQLQRLLVGAVWQQAQAIEAMRTEIKALTP